MFLLLIFVPRDFFESLRVRLLLSCYYIVFQFTTICLIKTTFITAFSLKLDFKKYIAQKCTIFGAHKYLFIVHAGMALSVLVFRSILQRAMHAFKKNYEWSADEDDEALTFFELIFETLKKTDQFDIRVSGMKLFSTLLLEKKSENFPCKLKSNQHFTLFAIKRIDKMSNIRLYQLLIISNLAKFSKWVYLSN